MLKNFREENLKLVETVDAMKKREYCDYQNGDDCDSQQLPAKKKRKEQCHKNPKAIWHIADELMVATNSCNDLVQEMKQVNEVVFQNIF